MNTASVPELSKADAKRQEIIVAAASIFARKGYAETTLVDVAKKLKIHTAGLYYYFESRDALVDALLKYAATRLHSRYQALVEEMDGQSASEKLKVMIRKYVQVDSIRDDVGAAFWKIYDQVSPELRAGVRDEAKGYFEVWRTLIREAAAEKSLRADIDPGVQRQLLMGCLVWIKEWYRPQGTVSADDIADAVISLFLSGENASHVEVAKPKSAPRKGRATRKQAGA
ncbi:hypothetical protein LK12_17795 [Novosphingobium malaysiense]|uniref:HTH tetR-type domain-containing protein n=1 Tax=Novosphingobium malaysiense TaxID=1348853 RepID=A0A0B1ZIS1_9SPHN|nr:hypothetical protein LK12_17795 [Novosphingobium malaysiense]